MAIAFPGAEGYGAGTQGARAGGTVTVYRVSNLNNSGSGSFREACEASGSRVIVFTTGGVITLTSTIEITDQRCTILGQTAPGDGITLYMPGINDPMMRIKADEVILRYIRFRHGEHKNDLGHAGDCLQIGNNSSQINNVIIDHCTFAWSTDELLSAYAASRNITIQWCLFDRAITTGSHGDNDPDHHKGLLMGKDINNPDGAAKCSVHHNLFTHVSSRCPRFKSATSDVDEAIGNVIYNSRCDKTVGFDPIYIRSEAPGESQKANVRNCTMKVGPNAGTPTNFSMIQVRRKAGGQPSVYENGNRILDINGNDITDSGDTIVRNAEPGASDTHWSGSILSVGHSYPITTTSASADYDDVLNGAGVIVPKRDSFDRDAISHVRNGTGGWLIEDEAEIGGIGTLSAGTAYVDTDSDGLPDEYCIEKTGTYNGLSATGVNASGYLEVEMWANQLSGDDTTGGPGGGGDNPPVGDGDINISISQSADDAYLYSDGPGAVGEMMGVGTILYTGTVAHSSTGTRTFSGHFSASDHNYRSLYRFQNIPIFSNSTVGSAYIKLYVTGINTSAPELRIYGIAEDNSADLATPADVKTRSGLLTDAFVAWTPGSTLDNQWATSPDISAIINEILSRTGWVVNNSLTLILQPTDAAWSTEQRAKFGSYDGDPQTAAELTINDVVSQQGQDSGSGSGTVDLAVVGASNDGYTRVSGGTKFDTTDTIYMGDNGSNVYDYTAFFLFEDIGIPQGVTIDTAYLTLTPASLPTTQSNLNLKIQADDSDDAAVPTTYADATGRTRTTASATWQPTGMSDGTPVNTSSIVTVIQELVNRAGWTTSSNALMFIADTTAGDSGVERRLGVNDAGHADSGRHPRLYVEWSGTTSIAVSGAMFRSQRIGARIGEQIAL